MWFCDFLNIGDSQEQIKQLKFRKCFDTCII